MKKHFIGNVFAVGYDFDSSLLKDKGYEDNFRLLREIKIYTLEATLVFFESKFIFFESKMFEMILNSISKLRVITLSDAREIMKSNSYMFVVDMDGKKVVDQFIEFDHLGAFNCIQIEDSRNGIIVASPNEGHAQNLWQKIQEAQNLA